MRPWPEWKGRPVESGSLRQAAPVRLSSITRSGFFILVRHPQEFRLALYVRCP